MNKSSTFFSRGINLCEKKHNDTNQHGKLMVFGKVLDKWLVIIFILLFSVSLRLWNFNQMGKTWDEDAYVEWGYNFVNMAAKGDFQNPYWYKVSLSPPLSSYLFGIPASFDVAGFDNEGKPIFNYDYSHVRLVSVLFSSLTVILVVLFGWKYISFSVGIFAGIILSMLPLFVGYSQLATLESLIIFFFTAVIFSFFNFLSKPSKINILLTGVLLGLAFSVKYSNFLLVPLLILIYLIQLFNNKKRIELLHFKSIFLILLIGFITFFVLWPMPWFHLREVIAYNASIRNSPYSVPEVFFGRLMHVPKLYYFIYFLITTPFLILSFFLIGLKKISNEKKWILYSIVVWFLFPFIQSFYNFRQHGIRYIIEIYAPLALIAAIGFDYINGKITRKILLKSVLFIPVAIYLFLILVKISPYYLEYFNIVVGGTKNVYEKKLFQMGWWGQGIREAAYYVATNAKKGSTVGIALSPATVMPALEGLRVSEYQEKDEYDYVIVNYYNILREGFDDSWIKKKSIVVYNVLADGASLVTVYKRK